MKEAIALVQVDGKWPNLALMKISAYYKNLGTKVYWYLPIFSDLYAISDIYASKIFSFTPDNKYIPEQTIRGGTGYDIEKKLPNEIESCFPDYSLYPQNDFALGFTTRGCIRNCPFCVVPRKEGMLRVVGDLYSFWRPETGFGKVRLLDNNLTAAPFEHFEKIVGQLKKHKLLVDFSQGLDARILTEDHARLLKEVRLWKQIHIAWDGIQDESFVRRGIENLKKHISLSKVMCFVLIGFNSMPEEDLYRVETLRSLGVDPFVMPFGKKDKYQKAFARWVNHKAIFKSVPWSEYNRKFYRLEKILEEIR